MILCRTKLRDSSTPHVFRSVARPIFASSRLSSQQCCLLSFPAAQSEEFAHSCQKDVAFYFDASGYRDLYVLEGFSMRASS